MSPDALLAGGAGFTALFGGLACLITVGTLAFIAVTFVVASKIGGRLIKGDPEINEKGVPGQATVLRIWDTGIRVRGEMNIQVGFELEVTPGDGRPSYQTQAKAVIPMINMAQFQPGAVVPVKIHPTDPSKVILDIYVK